MLITISPSVFGWISLAVAIAAYIPYFQSILTGNTRPHIFSWTIWGTLTTIAFFAQVTSGAGPGAWATGFTAVISFVIVGLALRNGEKQITRSDLITFLAALAAIPIWLITNQPLLAVILITLIDALGFWPTFRKSWHKPNEEKAYTYGLSTLKFMLALLALTHISWTTALYPASLVIMNIAFVCMIMYRRKGLR